jgi:hypothetical protein
VPNKFKFAPQSGGAGQPFEYSLPNDLYREYLKERGKYIARSLRGIGFIGRVEDAKNFLQEKARQAETEEAFEAAKPEMNAKIESIFDLYSNTIKKSIVTFDAGYNDPLGVTSQIEEAEGRVIISRTKHLRTMVERGIFEPQQVAKLKQYGLIIEEKKK